MTTRAVIICDMWDKHHCVSAARRVAELAPRMNAVVADLRASGALIIHAPADCAAFYVDSSARRRALGCALCAGSCPFRLEYIGLGARRAITQLTH